MAIHTQNSRFIRAAAYLLAAVALASPAALGLPRNQAAPSSAPRPIGAIKSISGSAIVLVSDAGPAFNVTVQDGAKIVRIEPGAKDLKNASPAELQDLQVGDRILVLGKVSDDGHSVSATSVIVMKKADVASKQEHDRQEWQRHAVGGLVSAVDPSAGAITISTQSLVGSSNITIRVSKDTIVRRYAPDSVKFDDAKPSSLADIKPGDQVRARGMRRSDGSELAADEIVSGVFRNIAGLVTTIDPASSTLTINDLISKKPVAVKVTPESQLRKLPPQIAQFMAMRLTGGAAGAPSGAPAPAAGSGQPGNGGPPNGGPGGRGGDMQQMLSRIPAATLADIQKGDAVMIVSTEGTASGGVTAITLLAGVEPILQASPNGGQMILPPWTLEAPGGDAAQ